MRLRPDLCLVQLAPPKERNAGGVIEAPAMQPPICYGKVRQVGEKVPLHGVHVGSIVGFERGAGEPLEGMYLTPHLLVSVKEVVVVLEREGV